MKPVSGFISFDGAFFATEEECCLHEERLTRFPGLAERCKAVVEGFRDGTFLYGEGSASTLIPKDLLDYLRAIPEDHFIDIWNEHLIHLFVDSEGWPFHEASLSEDHWCEFFSLTAETAYRVLAFVLGKTL